MKISILTLIFLLPLGIHARAQSITGRVVDGGSLEPMPGVNIVPEGALAGAASDVEGRFSLLLSAPGRYRLIFSHIGYEALWREVEVKEGAVADIGVLELRPAAQLLNAAVVVTARRSPEHQFLAPEAISVLTASEIARSGARAMPEALMGTAGVWMQKTNHGGGSPFVRGLTGNQVLLLLDGIRLNNSTYRYGPNQYFNTIDVLNVEQVEVQRGGGSVLHGSDALGGAIQVLTKNPAFSPGGWRWRPEALARWVSRDMEQSGRAALELSGEKQAMRAGFSYRNFGDMYAGGSLGLQAPSAYREMAAGFKALAKVGRRALLTLAYNGLFQAGVGRYDQVAQRGFQLSQFSPQNLQLGYARLQLQGGSPWMQQFQITASAQQSLEGRQSQKTGSKLKREEEDDVRVLGLSVEVHSRFGARWSAISGLEFYADKVGSQARDVDQESGAASMLRGLYPDGARQASAAAFTAHTIAWEQLSLRLGLRYNAFRIAIEDPTFGDTRISPSALVGNAAATYRLNDRHAISASLNTGFRSPNINDLSSFGSFDFGIEVPSQGLSPERSLTAEAGYKLTSGRLAGGLALYRAWLSNLIARVPASYQGQPTYNGEDVYKKENIEESFIEGYELELIYRLSEGLSAAVNFTSTFGHNTSADTPMRRIPPKFGRLALTYEQNRGWFGQAELLFAGRQGRLAPGDLSDHRINPGGTPAWEVVNLRGGYRFRRFHLHAGLQNLLDEAYRFHGSGIDGPGRSVWVGVGARF